jgi:hypothetical protein
VDYWQRVLSLHKLNEELKRQGLPKVTEETYHWRMAQILPQAIRKKSAQNKSSQQPSTRQSAQRSLPESSSALSATDTWHHDLDESDTTQRLAAEAVLMVDSQARVTSNSFGNEAEAIYSGPYYNIPDQSRD